MNAELGLRALDLEQRAEWLYELVKGRPLGFARAPAAATGHPPLAGQLRAYGSAQVGGRRLVALPIDEVSAVEAKLERYAAMGHGDPCWLRVGVVGEGVERTALLLSDGQYRQLQPTGRAQEVELPNCQFVESLWVSAESSPPSAPPARYCDQTLRIPGFTFGVDDEGDLVLQATPTSPLAKELPSQHAFYALVNPHHEATLGRGFCVVSNPLLEAEFPGAALHFPVAVHYLSSVPIERVALDDTVLLAVGARPGEPCSLRSVRRGRLDHLLARRLFAYRHAVCRVTTSTTTDQEKPLVRLPVDVCDVLGITSDSKVVVESVAPAGSDAVSIRRARFRALEMRSEVSVGAPVRLRGTGPNFLGLVGSIDLPQVAMDKVRRETVGASIDGPVYVRPAVGSLLAAEISAVTLLLGAGLIGTLATENTELAAVLVAGFLVLVVIQAIRRLR